MADIITDITDFSKEDGMEHSGISILPKPDLPKKDQNLSLQSAISLTFYLIIGFFFFNQNWVLLLILTAVVMFHEGGHFAAMKYFGYGDLGIFFIPLLGAFVSGSI